MSLMLMQLLLICCDVIIVSTGNLFIYWIFFYSAFYGSIFLRPKRSTDRGSPVRREKFHLNGRVL